MLSLVVTYRKVLRFQRWRTNIVKTLNVDKYLREVVLHNLSQILTFTGEIKERHIPANSANSKEGEKC